MTTDTSTLTQEVIQAEMERCRAVTEKDWPALEKLLAADYSHVYMTGEMHGPEEYMALVKINGRKTTRDNLQVRLIGDVAVMTGTLILLAEEGKPENRASATQVWMKKDGAWKQAAFQASRIQPAAGA